MKPVYLDICSPINSYKPDLNKTCSNNELNNTGKNIPAENKKSIDKSSEVAAKSVKAESSTHLKFQIHDKTGDVIVKIIDDNTGDVIKEIPPEKILDMIAKFQEMDGIFIDEKR